jgi:hypothetical protein
MQQFFVEWKNVIERAYEATPTTSSMHPSMNEETLKSDRSDTKVFLTTICQIAQQYSYVPKYYRAHVGRAMWEANACSNISRSLLNRELNPSLAKFLMRTDHWTRRKPTKSLEEQGYDMGLRGMSTHGCQIEFAGGEHVRLLVLLYVII